MSLDNITCKHWQHRWHQQQWQLQQQWPSNQPQPFTAALGRCVVRTGNSHTLVARFGTACVFLSPARPDPFTSNRSLAPMLCCFNYSSVLWKSELQQPSTQGHGCLLWFFLFTEISHHNWPCKYKSMNEQTTIIQIFLVTESLCISNSLKMSCSSFKAVFSPTGLRAWRAPATVLPPLTTRVRSEW